MRLEVDFLSFNSSFVLVPKKNFSEKKDKKKKKLRN